MVILKKSFNFFGNIEWEPWTYIKKHTIGDQCYPYPVVQNLHQVMVDQYLMGTLENWEFTFQGLAIYNKYFACPCHHYYAQWIFSQCRNGQKLNSWSFIDENGSLTNQATILQLLWSQLNETYLFRLCTFKTSEICICSIYESNLNYFFFIQPIVGLFLVDPKFYYFFMLIILVAFFSLLHCALDFNQ